MRHSRLQMKARLVEVTLARDPGGYHTADPFGGGGQKSLRGQLHSIGILCDA